MGSSPGLGRDVAEPFDTLGDDPAHDLLVDCPDPGAIAQLGERRAGSAKVVGSSPTSSTPRMDDRDGYFGESVAAHYDDSLSDMFASDAVAPVVECLAALAGDGRALELGIGTGRIALPLAARGVPVHGIELSRAIVAKLREKPGGDAISVTIGDFASARADGTFALAYLVFNTIMNLTTQAEQVACFGNVAAHLRPGGRFVIEVGVPDLRRLPPGETYRVFHVGEESW